MNNEPTQIAVGSGSYSQGNNTSSSADCMVSFPTGKVSTINGLCLVIISTFIMICIIISNSTLIYGLIKTRQIRARAHQLFLVVSSCDLIIGVVLIPLQIFILNADSIECPRYAMQSIVCHFFEAFSVLLIFGINLDRYFLVMKKSFYLKQTSKPITSIYLFVSVVIAFVLSGFSGYATRRFRPYRMAYFLITQATTLILVITLTLFTNVTILKFVHSTAKEMKRYSGTSKYTMYDNKAQRTILLITYTTFFTYLPAVVAYIYSAVIFLNFSGDMTKLDNVFYILTWLTMPIFLNAAFNATIFIYRNDKIRKLLRKQFRPAIKRLSCDYGTGDMISRDTKSINSLTNNNNELVSCDSRDYVAEKQ